jgi:hypothetical protein
MFKLYSVSLCRAVLCRVVSRVFRRLNMVARTVATVFQDSQSIPKLIMRQSVLECLIRATITRKIQEEFCVLGSNVVYSSEI